MEPSPRPVVFLALAALAALSAGAAAQAPETRLPRVIYGDQAPAEPRVLYGEPSPAPAPPRPAPQAPEAAPPPPASGTTIFHGWVPVGPPRWEPWPGHAPPVGHPPPWRPLPEPPPRDTRYEAPQPMGTYIGRPPSAALPQAPAYGRQGR
jgi:hypothetical protein